jgi:hypothetical protein
MWESPEAAEEFLAAYRRVLEGKWTSFVLSADSPGRLTGRGDDGFFLLRRDGPYVYCFEGLAAPEEAP